MSRRLFRSTDKIRLSSCQVCSSPRATEDGPEADERSQNRDDCSDLDDCRRETGVHSCGGEGLNCQHLIYGSWRSPSRNSVVDGD